MCRIVKLRKEGIDLPRWKIRELAGLHGSLEVLDVRDDGVGRSIKVAWHSSGDGITKHVTVLYEPHLIWMSSDRFTIAGFERVQVGSNVVNFAQSWLCQVELENKA